MASDEILREIKELMAEIKHEHGLNRDAYQQGMELTARLIDRVDAMFQRNAKVLDRMAAQIDANTHSIREHTETIRMMRESLLRFLDRLDESGGATPA